MVRRAFLATWLGGCEQVPPTSFKDTGFVLQLDSGGTPVEDVCAPSIPASTTLVTAAQALEGEGPFFVCQSVPVTLLSDGAVVFVSAFASAAAEGNQTITYAKSGAQVHASGARSAIVAETGALASVAQASSVIEVCDTLSWDPLWDEACFGGATPASPVREPAAYQGPVRSSAPGP